MKKRLARARQRWPMLDHLIATFEHYSRVEGNVLAGAVTYFGFLSFFPVLAIAFAVVGVVTGAYPDAEESVTDALTEVFPGLIGSDEGQIDPSSFEEAAAAAGVIGAVGLLYTGLGWLSALRQSLQDVFEVPRSKAHNFVVGKLVDLVMLAVIGIVLVVSVAVSGAISGFADEILEVLALDDVTGMGALLGLVGILLGLLASMVLFVVAFRLLARPSVSGSALWRGAALAAVGFEVLKLAASFLIAATKDNPAFAVLGTALILIVWISYFSRLLLIGAAWAATADRTGARTRRVAPVGERELAPVAVGTAAAGAAAGVDQHGQPDGAGESEEGESAEERVEAAVELVRSGAVLLGVTWLLRRFMRSSGRS